MNVLILAGKDLRRLVRDRKALVINLLLPLVLTFIMGLSFGGGMFGASSGISAIPIAIVANNLPEILQDQLAQGLTESGYFTVTWTDSLTADTLVRQGDAAAAVVIPEDLFEKYFEQDKLEISIWKDPGSQLKAGIVEQILSRAVSQFQAGEATYLTLWPDNSWAQNDTEQAAWFEEMFSGDFDDIWQRLRTAENDTNLARLQSDFLLGIDRQTALSQAMGNAGVVLQVQDKSPSGGFEKQEEFNLFNYFLPSFAVFFLMFAVAASTRDLHREQKAGTLQRQMLAPLNRVDFLLGKWIFATMQGVLMLLVLFVVGAVLFRVNLGPDPYSLLVATLLCSTAAASVFTLLALLSPTEKFMDNLSTIFILVTAMVGGNMVPLDNLPSWMMALGQMGFNYWANTLFQGVVLENQSFSQNLQPMVVLAAFSLVLLAVNVVLFRIKSSRGRLA